MKRRNFIQTTGMMLAALAGGAATARIRTAFYGVDHSHFAGKLRVVAGSPDFELSGICEPDAGLRTTAQRSAMLKDVRWVTEQELLGDKSIQLVVVECGVADTVPRGKKVIAAGKHLHLEKAPGNRLEPYRELVEEARRRGLLLQAGYIWRFHQGFRAALDAAREGWLGNVYMLRATINTDGEEKQRSRWALYSGGMMFELGGHQIDRVVDLWGKPKSVKPWLRHDTGFPDKLADNTLAVLEYEQGLAIVSSSARMPGHTPHRSFEIVGTDGTVLLQPIEGDCKVRIALRQARGPYKEGTQVVEFPGQNRYTGDFRELAAAIREKRPLKYSYDYELMLHETILRASGELA